MRHYRKPATSPYQNQFANNLVHSLGIDSAIDICVQNSWGGTLSVILNEKRNRADWVCH